MKPYRLVSLAPPLLLLVYLVLAGFSPIGSEDTWWHLAQGRLYLQTRSLPAQDPFAFTTAGRQWIHYSWLADILFYLVYAAAGLGGLVVLRLGFELAIGAALYRIVRRAGASPTVAAALVALAATALRFRLLVRSEIIAFLLFAACAGVLMSLSRSRPRTAWLLLPIQVAWINVHGSALFGVLLPALVLAANMLPPALRAAAGRGLLAQDAPHRRALARVVALLPVASLANPRGFAMLTFPFRQNTMVGLDWLTEWMPLWKLPGSYGLWPDVVFPFAAVAVVYAALSVALYRRERRPDPAGDPLFVMLGVYSVYRNRAVPFFMLAMAPFVARAWARLVADRRSAKTGRGGGGMGRWPIGAVLVSALLILGIGRHVAPGSPYRHGFGVRPGFFPEGAAAFLETNHIEGPIFNSHEFGGYLIWRRWPANQVLIDGRYDGILFDGNLLREYAAAHASREVFDDLVRRYDIGIALTSARPGRELGPIQSHPAWVRVYRDNVAEVYLRR